MNDEYTVFVIVVDNKYPMPDEPAGWEGGWYPVTDFDDYNNAEWFAEYLQNTGKEIADERERL